MNALQLYGFVGLVLGFAATASAAKPMAIESGASVVMLGNGLGAQMLDDGGFETLVHQRYPAHQLTLRNLCFEGDTPAYRPRAGRPTQWAFPGAEQLRSEYQVHRGKGIEPSPDEWLTLCKADMILGFFGYNESFDGAAGTAAFAAELEAWITHSLSQKYNGKSAPKLVLVSPMAYENLSKTRNLPDGVAENRNLQLYAEVMRKVAVQREVPFVDLWTPTFEAMKSGKDPLTVTGFDTAKLLPS